MSEEKITPYTLSTFGRVCTEYNALDDLMNNESSDVQQLRTQWMQLQPLLNRLLCMQEDGVESLMHEIYTGMATAEAQGIPPEAAEIWNQLRVLQGLHMHLQIWLMVSTHHLVQSPHMAGILDYNATVLIDAIWGVLCSNEAVPDDVEPWAEQVIDAACEKALKYRDGRTEDV